MDDLWRDDTRWRTARAGRVAWLVDSQAYFSAAYDALLKAQRSVLLLGWGFDPRTRLAPDGGVEGGEPDEIGKLLLRLSEQRPDLDIRLLVWKSSLPISATQEFFPHRARQWFERSRVKFVLDDRVPFGACHHQKLLVIDDTVAFTGGGDFATDRWDSVAHRDEDTRRAHIGHSFHAPRHEVMVMVDGEAARALGDHARERWSRATGEVSVSELDTPLQDAWPRNIRPDLRDIDISISRTEPAWRHHPATQEIRRLARDSIFAAQHYIYLENQYFTSPLIAEALAARLAEPYGPEVVLISTHQAPSWFDRLTMDRVRSVMIRRLQEADVFGRFRAYSPVTPAGRPIIVHSKVSIIDDQVVRIGSANLNNRSFGFDTELEIGLETRFDTGRATVSHLRSALIGHFLSRDAEAVERAMGPD
ncbi:MAG: phospholipase D-like domain-containing protein, partial [Alphaproteobacteria bacterium]